MECEVKNTRPLLLCSSAPLLLCSPAPLLLCSSAPLLPFFPLFPLFPLDTTVLSSTFLLTLLLMVGLFFFIRAATKERSQEVKLLSEQPEELLLTQLQQYFQGRSYRPIRADEQTHQITFEGFVRPSWFLAIFLTVLAACGLFCLALVLSVLFPQIGIVFVGLVLLAPAAGIFYWRTAGRLERVSLKVETLLDRENSNQNLITVTAHRDELEVLQQSLNLRVSQ